jgi:hypothetical protein
MKSHVRVYILSILLGFIFWQLSITITGLGAAIAISPTTINFLRTFGDGTAFAIINFFTIVIPLLICFFVFLLALHYSNTNVPQKAFLLVAAPFVVSRLYIFGSLYSTQVMLPSLVVNTVLVSVLTVLTSLAFCKYVVRVQGV